MLKSLVQIILRPHLKIRLKQRLIPLDYPKMVIISPDTKYQDNLTKHSIAVKQLVYGEKQRLMVVVYDIINTQIQVITIYPTKPKDIKSKLRNKRWIKL